jgi:hypothetical protein
MSTPWTARRTTTRVAVEFDFVKPLTALKGFGFQRGQLRLDESRQTPKPLSLGSRQNSSGRAWPLLNSTKRQSSIKKPAASGEDAAGAGANPGEDTSQIQCTKFNYVPLSRIQHTVDLLGLPATTLVSACG